MNHIKYFKLKIEPFYYADDNTFREFHFEIFIDGEIYNFKKIVDTNDMKSIYEMLFELAKNILKKEIFNKERKT